MAVQSKGVMGFRKIFSNHHAEARGPVQLRWWDKITALSNERLAWVAAKRALSINWSGRPTHTHTHTHTMSS